MSRYLCEKTVKESPTGITIHTAGKVYPEDKFHIMGNGWVCLKNDFGEQRFYSRDFLSEHFRELEEIGVIDDPYTDHESVEYAFFLQNHKGCSKGVAICIASAIAIGIIIYKALTWGS